MEGIERIKSHILADADDAVEVIVDEARAFVAKELGDSERQREEILAEAAERTEHDANLLLKRGQSVADAERRKRDLEYKQEFADQVIERAIELLREQTPQERVRRYASWIRELGLEEGVIALSATDQMELSGDLLKALPQGRFSIDERPGDFLGGVRITHGRICDNLTYDLVVRDNRQELTRVVFEYLEASATKEELGG